MVFKFGVALKPRVCTMTLVSGLSSRKGHRQWTTLGCFGSRTCKLLVDGFQRVIMADSASAGLLQRAAPAVEIKRRRRTKTPDLVTLTNEAHRGNMHLKRNLHQHEQQPVRKRFRCKTSTHETREACRRPKKPMDPQNTAQTTEAKRKKNNSTFYNFILFLSNWLVFN